MLPLMLGVVIPLRLIHTAMAIPLFVQYPFMTPIATEKMGIMESGDSVHTAVVTATKNIEFLSPFHCHDGKTIA